MPQYCFKCGKELDKNDIGAHKKLVNRGATKFMCVSCLSAFFKVEESLVRRKIQEFKNAGCLLFK